METKVNFDPAGQLDLRELDALATNEAAGLTTTIVVLFSVSLSLSHINGCGTKNKK